MIHPVILCGGSGTRLWPLSRQSYPKQFSGLIGDNSLFQASARRCATPDFAAPLVITGDPFRFIVLQQLAEIGVVPQCVLIEPTAKNTAPAVAAASLWLAGRDPDALVLILPSDHVLPDAEAFRAAVTAAAPRAASGDFVTFGIAPTGPETGYGYLALDAPADFSSGAPVTLAAFVEKPDATRAGAMIADGRHLWNAGIFLFRAGAMIDAFRRLAPAVLDAVDSAVKTAKADLAFTRLGSDAWAGSPAISIDYAIMEKSRNLAVMPYAGRWSDLGSWQAVWSESGPDGSGNVVSENATAIDCRNSLLRSESDGLELVAIGLDGIVCVAMPDAVVVAPAAETQRVREAVDALKAKGAKQATQFTKDHRPWGWFESLAIGDRFQVKRIVVNPGAALSLQSHHHRSEHWIVVKGTARVTVDSEVRLVSENQSVYVPLGAVHRMENPGKVPMVLIEVQTGSYLGEDDIIRYEDVYARG